MIVDFIKKLRNNPTELEILGSGDQRKSYLDVRECVDAMLFCVSGSDERVNVFNIGSEDTLDVRGIAEIIVGLMGLSEVVYRFTGGIEGRGWRGDVRVMQLSIDRIKRLGWRPRSGSADAVEAASRALLAVEGSG